MQCLDTNCLTELFKLPEDKTQNLDHLFRDVIHKYLVNEKSFCSNPIVHAEIIGGLHSWIQYEKEDIELKKKRIRKMTNLMEFFDRISYKNFSHEVIKSCGKVVYY